MSTTELAELELLLERVLPDPIGFAERVFEQYLKRLGPLEPHASGDVLGVDVREHQVLQDRSVLLAAALGACECWGERADCTDCGGKGTPGWLEVEPVLFAEFVQPALARNGSSGEPTDHTAATEDWDDEGSTTMGEKDDRRVR